jgi:hypothetical protein
MLQEAAVVLAGELRVEHFERGPGVSHKPHLCREAQADAGRVPVDLHTPRLIRLRIVLDVGEGRADDQERVASLEGLLRGARAQKPDASGGQGVIVRYHAFAEQGLDDGSAEKLRRADQLVAGLIGTLTSQDGDLLPGIQDLRRTGDRLRVGNAGRLRLGEGGVMRNVAVGGFHRRLRLLLHVHRDRHMGNAAVRQGHAAGQFDGVLHLQWAHDPGRIERHVLEQLGMIHVLLREGVDEIVIGQAGDRNHGGLVKFGVVEPVKQVNAARTGGGETAAELAGELGIGAGHEGC